MTAKSGKPCTKPVPAKLTPNMTREPSVENPIDVLRESGTKVKPDVKKFDEGSPA
jgi:hypothetical protein